MTPDTANQICATHKGAVLDHPFGEDTDVWKVGDKMFALIGIRNNGIILKCQDADSAAMLIDVGVAVPAPYLKRGGWVLLLWDKLQDEADLTHRISVSYDTVLGSLTKKAQAEISQL